MFINLPDELIYKIVNNLESTDIYNLTLTSRYLNKMKFQAILTALMFKNYWGIYKEDLLDFKQWGYTLGNYLSDLSEVNNYSRVSYQKKQSIYLEEKCIDLIINRKIYLKKRFDECCNSFYL